MHDILNSLDIKPYNDKRVNLKALTISAMDAGRDLVELIKEDLPQTAQKRVLSLARTQLKTISYFCTEYDKATWKVYKKLESMRELFIPQKKLDALFEEKRAVVSDAQMVVEQLKDFIEVTSPKIN